jgi:hypothetical protein
MPSKTLPENAEIAEAVPEQDGVLLDTTYKLDDGDFNARNNRWYTYQYDEATFSEHPAEPPAASHKAVYEITETSRPPLFNKNCLTAANPEQCSNEAVLDWMQYAVEKPKAPGAQNQTPMHYVRFIVNKQGKVTYARIIPTTPPQTCAACEAATREAIAGMPSWMPAIREGQAVRVRVTLPVYYN